MDLIKFVDYNLELKEENRRRVFSLGRKKVSKSIRNRMSSLNILFLLLLIFFSSKTNDDFFSFAASH